MAGRIYEGDLTVPAGTPATAPVSSAVPVDLGTLRRITLEVPPGHAGLTGWMLLIAGTPVIPYAGGKWLIADNYTDEWELNQEVNPGQVLVSGYNTDIYQHTFYARLLIERYTPPPAISITSTETGGPQANLAAIGQLSNAPVGQDVIDATQSPYVSQCYDINGEVVDCDSPDAVAGPVTYIPGPEPGPLPGPLPPPPVLPPVPQPPPIPGPPGPPPPPPVPQPPPPPPGPQQPPPPRPPPPRPPPVPVVRTPGPPPIPSELHRHVASGAESLNTAARYEHNTVGQVVYVTRHRAPITPAHLAAFERYVLGGTARPMPAGLIYWTADNPHRP